MRALIDASLGGSVAYYQAFPWEPSRTPTRDMRIDAVVPIDPMTLLGVLEAMRGAADDGDRVALIVGHGVAREREQGFTMPIAPGGRSALVGPLRLVLQVRQALIDREAVRRVPTTDATTTSTGASSPTSPRVRAWITLINGLRSGTVASGASVTEAEAEQWFQTWVQAVAQQGLGLSPAQLLAVIQALDRVRGRFDRVEVRACNMGQAPETLAFYREFFAVREFLAPTVGAFDVQVRPHIMSDPHQFARWYDRSMGRVVGGVYGRGGGPSGRSFYNPGRQQYHWLSVAGRPNALRGVANDVFALRIWETSRAGHHAYTSDSGALNVDAVRAFIEHRIMAGGTYARGTFWVVGLWTFETSASTQPYVLPLDPEYRALIASDPDIPIQWEPLGNWLVPPPPRVPSARGRVPGPH